MGRTKSGLAGIVAIAIAIGTLIGSAGAQPQATAGAEAASGTHQVVLVLAENQGPTATKP